MLVEVTTDAVGVRAWRTGRVEQCSTRCTHQAGRQVCAIRIDNAGQAVDGALDANRPIEHIPPIAR